MMKTSHRTGRRSFLGALAAPILLPQLAYAQSWPQRPVKIIVPYAAGGTTDVVTRLVAQRLIESLGRNIIVENRPGGGGVIGTTEVARAPADGYTLLVGAPNSFSINQFMFRRLAYSPERDLVGIALIGQVPNILMTNPDILPAKRVAELIAYIRERPGQISAGSGGIATSGHLSLELFKVMTGLDIVHVPYNSSGLARADLLAGRCQMAIDNLTSYVTDVERGTVRALATGTLQPTRFLPGIPTLSASGLDGYSSTAWYALACPSGVSPDIIVKLNQEVNHALSSPAFVERLNRLGVEALGGSPDDAKNFFASEARKWKVVVEAARTVLDQ